MLKIEHTDGKIIIIFPYSKFIKRVDKQTADEFMGLLEMIIERLIVKYLNVRI